MHILYFILSQVCLFAAMLIGLAAGVQGWTVLPSVAAVVVLVALGFMLSTLADDAKEL